MNVAGIDLRVWGMDRLSGGNVAVMFFLHGRMGSKEQVERECIFANVPGLSHHGPPTGAVKFILPRVWKSKGTSPNNKDLLMVTLDARYVGTRLL